MNDLFVNNIFQEDILFEKKAIELFHFQNQNNIIYKNWCDTINVNADDVKNILQIPFLPISFFKTHKVITGNFSAEVIFESSGTTQTINSKHFIKHINIYKKSFLKAFELFYGDIKDWCIIGLLPSYLERNNSSLICMVDELIKLSNNDKSGFYLNEFDKLADVLKKLEKQNQKAILIGVTFALLDFAEQLTLNLNNTIVMETGGMKGRREEMTRIEVHDILKKRFDVKNIHSEYGMTELLSQAYSKKDGIFFCPPWVKVLVRDEDDPLKINNTGKGALNIIDLANMYSCAFIATDDAASIFEDRSFEILGRIDNSDLRGCSLLAL